jgi:NAD(P)-dependent dehydrogenase (short-subunit alcohol dehydrogenase family)
MKHMVITGGTRGIGNGLARAFLKRGWGVMVTSRDPASLDAWLKNTRSEFPACSVEAELCDVRDFNQVQSLWENAKAKFGSIDIWINNAGIGNAQKNFWELDVQDYTDVVTTNLIGTMHGSKVAINGFIQQGYGALYNLEGLGSKDNRKVKGQSVYGTTKAALYYLDQAIAAELEQPGIIVGALQPGMVMTDLITGRYKNKPEEWKKVEGILSSLSGDVNEVTEALAIKILANQRQGARLTYNSTFKTLVKMIKAGFGRKAR